MSGGPRALRRLPAVGVLRGLAGLVGLVGALACGPDPSSPGVAYLPNMASAVSYDAYAPNPATRDGQTLQAPVPGTVPRGFRPHRYAATPADAERAGRELASPFQGPAPAAALARGKAVYETFCLVCHGATGEGDGPLIPKYPNPPSYASERLLAMPDGQIFHVITRGTGGLMPGYAAQITPEDRWQVVLWVRHLQASRRAAPGAPAEAP
jgi:mono/diheme cytochrome c family protein